MPSKDCKTKSSKRGSKGAAQIQSNGGYLRIQLPRHLFGGKQKYFSLNLTDTIQNRAKAQIKLLEIQRDIDYGEFDSNLNKYKKNDKIFEPVDLHTPTPTGRELLKEYEHNFFLTKKHNRKSENYLYQYKGFVNNHLKEKLDVPFTRDVVDELIKSSEAGSAIRILLIKILNPLCQLAKLEYNFSGLGAGYEPKSRNLPTDDEIVEAWNSIKQFKSVKFKDNAESWAWIYGVIATYGLRTHEVLAIDYEKSFKLPAYALYINEEITDGTKTGSRIVFPLPIEWVTLFDLTNPKLKVLEPFLKDIKSKILSLSNCFNRRLRDRDITFPAYNLRHRYAIRGHELNFSPNCMSKWMGHSLSMHSNVYQKYMDYTSHNKVYLEGLNRIQESKQSQTNCPSPSELEQQLESMKHQLELANLKINHLETELSLMEILDKVLNKNNSSI